MAPSRGEYSDKSADLFVLLSKATDEIQSVEGKNILPTVHFYPYGDDEVGVTIYYIAKPQPCPKYQFVTTLNGRGASWVFANASGLVKIRMDKL